MVALRVALAAFALVIVAGVPGAYATPSAAEAQLDELMAEYWDYRLAEDPLAATRAGLTALNDRMPRVTPADQARRLAAEQRFRGRLRDIRRTDLGPAALVNADVLEWVLDDSIRGYQLKLSRIPFNTFSGFFMSALYASSGVRMRDAEDYEQYLERLSDIPRFFDENVANMREGESSGFVLPRIVIDGVLPTIKAQVKERPEQSSFFEPFRAMSERVSSSERAALEARARTVIAGEVMPAFQRLADYLENEYRASESIAATALVDGPAYYDFQIRRYTTITGLTADRIHEIGLAEVERIRSEMDAIIESLGFEGDFDAFGQYLRTDASFYATSADELLKEAAYIAKRIDYRMPGFFGHLPRQSYGVVPVPDEIAPNYTTGAYYGAPLGGTHGGAFWVNTYALDQRPLYELPALTLHEAVPGHHHQNAIALEMENAPEFRKDLYFSAFGEGWALYAEKLGVEMGIYRNAYEDFGRLSYEMWRACRLVIDTGIHSKGWSREQALNFLASNTSLSASNVRAEVDRYISWPGQALAYKLGELRVWSMRDDAEKRLGERFDLREFHDVLLRNGALPIATIETLMARYIEETLANR